MVENAKGVVMLQDLYRDTYRQILAIVDRHEISQGHNREVSAYLCFLSFSILGEQASDVVPVSPDEFMYQRFRLYAGLSRSDLLNNWNCPDIPDMMDNPLIIAFIAFGDLLINSSARRDYRSAPLVLHGLEDTTLFGVSMLKQVLPLTDRYIDRLIAIREYADSVRKKPAPPKQIFHDHDSAPPSRSSSPLKGIIVFFSLVFIVIIGFVIYAVNSPEPEPNKTRTSSNSSVGNPLNNMYNDYLNALKGQPTATSTPKPALIYNGRRFIVPDYTLVCPFEVKAGSDGDYYIYLKYQKAPTYSQEGRKRLAGATAPYESDIAFIVKAGQTVELDVPIGVYKLYYATGKTFFDTSILFGDATRFYESDDLLTLNASENYYNGHTITLYEVVNGNLDTDEISEKSFPTR